MPTKMDDVTFCNDCHYPLRSAVCDNCWMKNEQRAKEEKLKAGKLSWALGGDRSVSLYTLERFIITPRTHAAFNAVSAFLPLESDDNIYIYSSGNGVGKTHLAAIAVRRLLDINCSGRLLKPSQIYRILRSCESPKDEIQFIKNIVDLDVFALDDIDAAKDSEFTMQTMYDIVDGRYMRAAGGLIVTSNLSLGELEKRFRNGRITSRLHEMCGKNVFCLDGEPDRRKSHER